MDFLTKFELFKNCIRKWPHRRYRSLINKLSFCGNAIFKIKNSYKKWLFVHILWDLFSKLPKYTYELKMTYVIAPVQKNVYYSVLDICRGVFKLQTTWSLNFQLNIQFTIILPITLVKLQTMLKLLKQRMILVPIDLVKNGKSNMFLIVITNKTNRMITIARKSEKRKQ